MTMDCIIRRWKSPWDQRKSLEAVGIVFALVAAFSVLTTKGRKSTLELEGSITPSTGCRFPAIFNFGDSNSDTGGVSATFGQIEPPNGQTFFGFVDPLGYCCRHHGDYSLGSAAKAIVNRTEVLGASCSNPSEYISWDNIHYTEAANHWVSQQVLDGFLSDPPIPITEACL